jgi:hypothetical protein
VVPITTANPIIVQFGGRVKRTNALVFSMCSILQRFHKEFTKLGYKIHVDSRLN